MTDADITEALQTLIRDAFNAPKAAVSSATTALDIPGWDSLSHAVLIMSAEERFGVELDPEQPFSNVGELVAAIQLRLGP